MFYPMFPWILWNFVNTWRFVHFQVVVRPLQIFAYRNNDSNNSMMMMMMISISFRCLSNSPLLNILGSWCMWTKLLWLLNDWEVVRLEDNIWQPHPLVCNFILEWSVCGSGGETHIVLTTGGGWFHASNNSMVSSSEIQTGGGGSLMGVIWEDSLTTHVVVTSCG
jgi:hypothetical protein